MVVQETMGESIWNFDSVFAALKTSTISTEENIKPVQNTVSSENTTTPTQEFTILQSAEPPSLTRALSQDDDQTPKATPAIESDSGLGDMGSVLSSLGYQVEVKNPITPYVASSELVLWQDSTPSIDEAPTNQKGSKKSKSPKKVSSSDTEAIKILAKNAENGRRAVLDDFLGSSPEVGGFKTPKASRPKPRSRWTQDLTPSSVSPKTPAKSRREVSLAFAAAKKFELVLELHQMFPLDSGTIMHMESFGAQTHSQGIHVFVDISNILIGFHDALKRNRKINKNIRIPRQTLSFHNLSMTLERGRPTAKRFLAGSDDIDCIEESRLLGYTAHILQRVDKVDTSTPHGSRRRSGLTSSESDSATPTKMKRAEQAVDEVLHLAMLQSIVDTETPSIMVLASGDASQAEFSDGFRAQVERALLKGWKVEVMAFKATTGRGYQDKEWVARWNGAFKLSHLDRLVDLLHVPFEGSTF